MIDFIKECGMSLGTGLLVGIVFALIKLPIPAPPVIPAVFGILGITLGYLMISKFI